MKHEKVICLRKCRYHHSKKFGLEHNLGCHCDMNEMYIKNGKIRFKIKEVTKHEVP